jgi:hypothetical protein
MTRPITADTYAARAAQHIRPLLRRLVSATLPELWAHATNILGAGYECSDPVVAMRRFRASLLDMHAEAWCDQDGRWRLREAAGRAIGGPPTLGALGPQIVEPRPTAAHRMRRRDVLAWARAQGGPISVNQMRHVFASSSEQAHAMVARMTRSGLLRRVGHGLYEVRGR